MFELSKGFAFFPTRTPCQRGLRLLFHRVLDFARAAVEESSKAVQPTSNVRRDEISRSGEPQDVRSGEPLTPISMELCFVVLALDF